MSWQASKWAIAQQAGSGPAKAVLMVIAEAHGDDGCYLSHATIAARAEVSERCAWQHVNGLQARGLIDRQARRDSRGHRTTDLIRLRMASLTAPHADRATVSNPQEMRLGDQSLTADHDNPKPHVVPSLPARRAEEPIRVEPVRTEPASAKAPKRATSIPEGFPTDQDIEGERAYLAGEGWNIDARLEAASFRAHAETHDRQAKVWRAAFHNWILGAVRRAPGSAKITPVRVATGAGGDDPWRSRVQAFANPSNRYWNTTDWGPAPGKPGCAAPLATLIEFGFGGAAVVPFERRGAA